jgi:hypothetical protein
MMNFREIKDAIVTLLGNNQGSDFRTIGFQRQKRSAQEFENDDRLVQVLYLEGEFPSRSNSNIYSSKHQLRFNIEFTVSGAATGDIEKATDTAASARERSQAIENIKEATEKVDTQLDELIERVYQILMNAENRDFGLNKGVVSGRTIERIRKDDTIEDGTLIVKTGMMDLTCTTIEEIAGNVDPDPGSEKTIDTEIGISADETSDDVQKTGTETQTPVA